MFEDKFNFDLSLDTKFSRDNKILDRSWIQNIQDNEKIN